MERNGSGELSGHLEDGDARLDQGRADVGGLCRRDAAQDRDERTPYQRTSDDRSSFTHRHFLPVRSNPQPTSIRDQAGPAGDGQQPRHGGIRRRRRQAKSQKAGGLDVTCN